MRVTSREVGALEKKIRAAQMEKLTTVMTVREVAEVLRVHPATVYRLVRRGVLPGFKLGGNWRVNRESLDVWLSAGGPSHLTSRA